MEFSRILWVSQKAKSLWQPRIQRIERALTIAEKESVYSGMRRACIQQDKWWKNPPGFVTIGLDAVKIANTYAANAEPAELDEPHVVRTSTMRDIDVGPFLSAWNDRDDDTLGMMLGYPMCCTQFFNRTWKSGMIDPTAAMPAPSSLNVNPYNNTLLRWIGVRPVPHLPCSFECSRTSVQGRKYLDMFPEEERDWALELLSMPMEYDTLHGVGEVRTPLFKIAFSSQGRVTFTFIGDQPDGTVGGFKFPFVTNDWTLNGFFGPQSMKRAHEVVLSIAPKVDFTVDFGCGNGNLLWQMPTMHRLGIDTNLDAIHQGRYLYVHAINFVFGDINELPVPPHDLSLISIERLAESRDSGELKKKLAKEAIVYSYSDGIDKFDSRLEQYFGDWIVINQRYSRHTAAARLARV